MMPGMDGCELARRVQATPRHASTRMLMLTSGGLDDPVRFRELGIGGWLDKRSGSRKCSTPCSI